MGRAKLVAVQTFTSGPSVEAKSELWAGINRVLCLANLRHEHPNPLNLGIHEALTALHNGTAVDGIRVTRVDAVSLANLAPLLQRRVPPSGLSSLPQLVSGSTQKPAANV